MNCIKSDISVTPFLPMRGIYYIGQYGTSGYATAAKGYLYYYYSSGIPITWEPLRFDDSEMDDGDSYNVVVKSLIGKQINHDFVILHSTPDLWPHFYATKRHIIEGKVVIGYCTWETSMVPDQWVECINQTVNELWVPSSYNKQCFEQSGVTKSIRVVPHIYLPPNAIDRKRVSLNDESVFTFYTIGEMNPRKSIQETIDVFCRTFKSNDRVRLLVKTHYRDYTAKNKNFCETNLKEIIDKFPDPAPVHLLLENMSSTQINALHTIGDCYVSLSKSEGFGLPIFDAHNLNKKLIVTGYGGHMDFLGNSYPGLVKYKLGPVLGMIDYSGFQKENLKQEWAIPDLEHASVLMKNTYGTFI